MSSFNPNVNNFLNRAKGKIYSFISNIQYSPYDSNLNINSSLNKSQTFNKGNRIDLYRSDYIPSKNIKNPFTNLDKTYLGKKTLLSNFNNDNDDSNKKIINIPNDKRYHKSLLENSLAKIRNEIKQKREENIQRMNKLNEKKDELNNFFQGKNNNKGKFIGIFNNNNNMSISNTKEEINNTINLEENETNNNNGFNTDYICEDYNESFSITSNNKKKKLNDKNNIIIQKQSEFTYNNIIINNNNKDNSLFKEQSDGLNIKNSQNNFSFSVKFSPMKEKEKEKEEINKEINNKNNKIIFRVPKEEKKEIKKEEKKEDNNNKVLFGAPKECNLSEPLKDNIKFGFVKKKETEKKEENKDKEIVNKKKVQFFSGLQKIIKLIILIHLYR